MGMPGLERRPPPNAEKDRRFARVAKPLISTSAWSLKGLFAASPQYQNTKRVVLGSLWRSQLDQALPEADNSTIRIDGWMAALGQIE